MFNNKIILKSQERFKSDYHEVYTEELNKIALSSNGDKRLQTLDKITTYPYGTNVLKVCESEFQRNSLKKTSMMIVRDYFVENYPDCPFYDEIILRQK